MDKKITKKFFKAYCNKKVHKVFLEDVSVIYRVVLKKTPSLKPYRSSSMTFGEDTEE